MCGDAKSTVLQEPPDSEVSLLLYATAGVLALRYKTMPLRPNEFAVRDGDRVDFRADPLRLRVELANLVTLDRHDLKCLFEFSARVGEHSADKKLFVELLMSDRPSVTRDEVAIQFGPALENSVKSAVAKPVAQILSEAGRNEVEWILRKAADAMAFDSGLIVLPPFQLELTSPSLQRQQREAAQRSRAEEQAAGRLDHLRHATELLKQFDAIRAAAPSISAGQILERIAPADRGELLGALLASGAEQTAGQILYAVAGSQLVQIDLSREQIEPVAMELPTVLGPLRSVQAVDLGGDRRLLVGARGGVLLVDTANPNAAVAYAQPDLNSSLGFNRAIYLAESATILATHGEAGLVQWDLKAPASPVRRTPVAGLASQTQGAPRNIHAIDRSSALCSIGNCLAVVDGSKTAELSSESTAPIASIVDGGQRLFAIHEDGWVVTFDRETRKILRSVCRGGEVCAAGGLPWLGDLRLLLASPAGPIDCVGTEDSLVTRFNSVYRGFRNITASATWVAAVSPDRQRLILWNSWNGQAPVHDLHLISLTRHRIADIAFA